MFVLRDAFGYSHREVAELVELSEANCRQLHRRARQRLTDAEPPASTTVRPDHRDLVERFLRAARDGDLDELERMLAEDVSSVADGGGAVRVARYPVWGVQKVARYVVGTARRSLGPLTATVQDVNGAPAVLAWVGTTLVGVLVPDIVDDRITAVRIVADPDKLRFLGDQAARLSRTPSASGS